MIAVLDTSILGAVTNQKPQSPDVQAVIAWSDFRRISPAPLIVLFSGAVAC